MSSLQVPLRSAGILYRNQACIFCNSHQIVQDIHHNGGKKLSQRSNVRVIRTRSYATVPGQRPDGHRARLDMDEKSRLTYYTLTKGQGVLLIDSAKANSIVKEFIARQKTMDPASNIRHLASRYNVSVENLAALAIVTFRVKDLSNPDKRAGYPPSQHKALSGAMLQGCAQVEEPLAIVHVLTAAYYASLSIEPQYKEIASLFSQKEVALYRKTLEKLGAKAKTFALGPEALTLQGLFLEREGQVEKAKTLYDEAIKRCHLKYNPKSRHPMQLPLITPWNALGNLLKKDPNPNEQARARDAFKKGAIEGDDPISYYELAMVEDRSSPEWLRYTSKAAASGHRQAMVDLSSFYQEAKSPESPALESANMRKALSWLLGWKQGSSEALAREWLQAASELGHKPSTLQLAEYQESVGDRDGAQEYLRALLEPPRSANQTEEWPQLVQLAKKRLAGIKV